MRAALQRCGFNVATANYIIAQGFETSDDLLLVSENDISTMVRNSVRGNNVPATVTFPFLAVKKLTAFRHWCAGRSRTGQDFDPEEFTNEELVIALQTLREEEDRNEADEDLKPDKPDLLKTLSGWTKFQEKLINYLEQIRGQAKVPLTYLIRKHKEVTDEIRDAEYENDEARRIATTVLEGQHYEHDNERLWRELKSLTVDGVGWTYLKRFNRKQDGRAAYFALKTQCEGQSAVLTRKNKAYNQIAKARYVGERQSFNFARYVEIHQNAYNEIVDADPDEVIPESKRVADLLAGMGNANMQSGIDIVLGNPLMMNDFEATQQYLSTLIENRKQHQAGASTKETGPIRNASQTTTVKGNWKPENRYYQPSEWKKLTSAQQAEVRALKDTKRNATAHQSTMQKKIDRQARKLAELKRQVSETRTGRPIEDSSNTSSSEEEVAEPRDNAGDQFGRRGRSKKSTKRKKKLKA